MQSSTAKGLWPGPPRPFIFLPVYVPFPVRSHPQLDLLVLPLCYNLGVGNREMVGVEAHGLLAVLTCTVPTRAPEVWVAEVEALGSRVTFGFKSTDTKEEPTQVKRGLCFSRGPSLSIGRTAMLRDQTFPSSWIQVPPFPVELL